MLCGKRCKQRSYNIDLRQLRTNRHINTRAFFDLPRIGRINTLLPIFIELKCLINIKDPSGRVVHSHDTSQVRKGKVSYLAKKDGLYNICISCPSSNWFKSTSIKWSLSIEVGGSDIDLENVAKKSEISETLTILQNLKKKFNSMKLQQIYQKQMASNLYDHNKSVHNKMFYSDVAYRRRAIYHILVYAHAHVLEHGDISLFDFNTFALRDRRVEKKRNSREKMDVCQGKNSTDEGGMWNAVLDIRNET
ncbi:transmembrane protein [Plasmodium ovale curtisi]|uniref:Transmembrane protein n=1 Tax=Plasmodium ovale curtisi TaxID=864141 RepID=A0A1A8VUI6_PLAOA|nr:transmembrane protein [Plasmodium ovale curtisi]